MCQGVYVGEKEVLSQGELVAYCPKGLVFIDEDDFFEEKICLCPVDLKKTAELNGFIYKYDNDYDSFSPNIFLKRK